MKIKTLIIISFSLIITGCNHKINSYRLFQKKSVVKKSAIQTRYYKGSIDYKILRHDRVIINIYKYPTLIPAELNKRGILVDGRGNVNLPLVGLVKIAGLTQEQATKMLERRYSKYLKYPQLYLEAINKRVYVLGEVNKPGPVTLDKEQITVIEALAFAGGLKDRSKRDSIIVLSSSNGRLTMRSIDLTNFNTMQLNALLLRPNDVVYIQPNSAKITALRNANSLAPFNFIAQALAPFVSIKTLTK